MTKREIYTTADIAGEAGVSKTTAWRAIKKAGLGFMVGNTMCVEGEQDKQKVLAEIRGEVGNPNFKKGVKKGRGDH